MVNANMAPADPATALPKGGKVGLDAVGMKGLDVVCVKNGLCREESKANVPENADSISFIPQTE